MIVTRPMYRVFKPVAWEWVFKFKRKSWAKYYTLDMRKMLVQGARPTMQSILDEHNGFQGGYRCTLKLISPPGIGSLNVSDNHLGFDFMPPRKNWIGHTSFSYSVVNAMGYESDAKCCYISVT